MEKDLRRLAINELHKLVIGDYESLAYPLKELIRDVLGIPPDPLALVELLISLGVPEEKAAAVLNWREFEDLCSKILEGRGYQCLRGVRKTVQGERMEIDVLAFLEGRIILAECKMWSRRTLRFLVSRSRKEVSRKMRLLIKLLSRARKEKGRVQIVPVIVSWLSVKDVSEGQVAVIPLYNFPHFIDSLEEIVEDIAHVNLDFLPDLEELFNLRGQL